MQDGPVGKTRGPLPLLAVRSSLQQPGAEHPAQYCTRLYLILEDLDYYRKWADVQV